MFSTEMLEMILKLVELQYQIFVAEDNMLMDFSLKMLSWGISVWNVAYQKAIEFIMVKPEEFLGGRAWRGISIIMNALAEAGGSMTVFFFLAGVIKQTVDFRQLRNIETVISLLLRLVIANTVVRGGKAVVLWLVDIGQGIIYDIAAVQNMTGNGIRIPQDLFANAETQIPFLNILALLATILAIFFILVMSLYVLMIVYGRFFEIYTLIAFAPVSLSFLSAEFTQQYAFGYLKNVFAASLKGAAILIAGLVFQIIVSNGDVLTTESTQPLIIYMTYLINVIFYMLVFVMTAKTADTLAQRALGGG